MVDRKEFIDLEILPTLGEFADDFDVDGIVDEVADFDPVKGYVWKDEEFDYTEVLMRHDKTDR